MSRRVWCVESREPGGEWRTEATRTSLSELNVKRSCAAMKGMYPGREWRVVEYVPAKENDDGE